jgi:hypothetical protein
LFIGGERGKVSEIEIIEDDSSLNSRKSFIGLVQATARKVVGVSKTGSKLKKTD